MSVENEKSEQIEQLLETPDLAGALESEQFKRFLDQVPIAMQYPTSPAKSASSMRTRSSRNCPASRPKHWSIGTGTS